MDIYEEAQSIFERLKANPELRRVLEIIELQEIEINERIELARREVREKMREETEKKVREEDKFQIAKNLLKVGVSIEDISMGTGLFIEQIEKFNGSK
jgi:hypothetical protein